MLDFKNSIDADPVSEINGDVQKANLYLCLLTPWFETSGTHYGDSQENVLAQEFEALLNKKISPRDEIGLISAIGNYVKQVFSTNYSIHPTTDDLNDFKDSWNKFSSEFYLNNKFQKACLQELNNLIDQDSLKITRLLKNEKLVNSIDDLFSGNFLNK